MAAVSPPAAAVTLLFCHGGGFCQNIWEPIIARLRRSPLLERQQLRVNMVTFDFPFHGQNRDVSQRATLHLENPASPRVSHPAMEWGRWSPLEVQRQVRRLREQNGGQRTPLIGIGHSMGAAALWKTEGVHPGTFDGLVLFEPMVNVHDYPSREKSIDFLVSVALNRPSAWESLEQAHAELLSSKNFARWHHESLLAYARGAVCKVSREQNVVDPDAKFALSCHPHFEASLYCSGGLPMTDEELASARCPIAFQYGGRSHLFRAEYRKYLVDKYADVYSIAQAVPDTSHALVMEDPDTCTSRILDSLAKLPIFQTAPAGTARL